LQQREMIKGNLKCGPLLRPLITWKVWRICHLDWKWYMKGRSQRVVMGHLNMPQRFIQDLILHSQIQVMQARNVYVKDILMPLPRTKYDFFSIWYSRWPPQLDEVFFFKHKNWEKNHWNVFYKDFLIHLLKARCPPLVWCNLT